MKSKFRMLLSAITFVTGLALLFAALALPLRLPAQVEPVWPPPPHHGYCQVDDSQGYYQLNGLCVSYLFQFCYIRPANPATCGAAFPPTRVGITTCGGIGSTLVDLARPCSFP
jgi:hypothetical protein